MRDKLREALGKWKCERCHGAGVVHTHPPAWNEPPVKCFQCDGDGMHPIARAALADTEDERRPNTDLTTLEASLKRDEELAGNATPGPWEADGDGTILHILTLEGGIVAMLPSEMSNDAAFIAHARTALLARVKDCRELMEEVKRYRDIFAEITAKAAPLTYSEGDPERITSYSVPVGPIHRAAGKTGFQMFNGEEHLLAAVKEAREANERAEQAEAERDLWLSTWTAWQTRAAAAESSLAEAIRALAVAHGRLLDADICPECGTHELFTGSNDACDTCGAHLEPYRAVLSSFQPRKDTP